jgi:hypothetical protein
MKKTYHCIMILMCITVSVNNLPRKAFALRAQSADSHIAKSPDFVSAFSTRYDRVSSGGDKKPLQEPVSDSLSQSEKQAFLSAKHALLSRYPEYKIYEEKLDYFIINTGPDIFSKKFMEQPEWVLNVLWNVVNEWDKYIMLTNEYVKKNHFSIAFNNSPSAVYEGFYILSTNWDKFIAFLEYVDKDHFSKAYACFPSACCDMLDTIFVNWDRLADFMNYVNRDDFSAAFSNDFLQFSNCLKISFHSWDKFVILMEHIDKHDFSNAFSNNTKGVFLAFYEFFNEHRSNAMILKYDLWNFVKQITQPVFSEAFAKDPAALYGFFSKISLAPDKFIYLMSYVKKSDFLNVFKSDPKEVYDLLQLIFQNWDEFELFMQYVDKDDFSKAFSDNTHGVSNCLLNFFDNLTLNKDKVEAFISHITKPVFSKAFSDGFSMAVDSLFDNWDEYLSLYEKQGMHLKILRGHALESNNKRIESVFITANIFGLLRLLNDLPSDNDKKLLTELIDKKGLKGLYLVMKFFYEFSPLFPDSQKPAFIRNYLDSTFINHDFGFRNGRNYVFMSAGGGSEILYTITKVFDSTRNARKEYEGLKLLEQFGRVKNPLLDVKSTTVTYSVSEPGIFIMPTEFLSYMNKKERMDSLTALLEEALFQIYTLARLGYAHTSLTSLSHGIRDDNTSNIWIPYRGGEINDVRFGLRHLNFRMDIGLVDAEHIFHSMELQELDSAILNKDIAGAVFELLLGLSYAGTIQGFSNEEIAYAFSRAGLSMSHRGKGMPILKGCEKRLINLLKDVQDDFIPHQRESDSLLLWLEKNLPSLFKAGQGEGVIVPAGSVDTPYNDYMGYSFGQVVLTDAKIINAIGTAA